jgi:hypothetical protein
VFILVHDGYTIHNGTDPKDSRGKLTLDIPDVTGDRSGARGGSYHADRINN